MSEEKEKEWVECPRCEGEGHLEIGIPGNWIVCPECETVGGWYEQVD